MGVEQSIDEVKVPRTAATRTDGEAARELGFRTRREGSALLVADVGPPDLLPSANRIGDPVEGVAGDAVNSLDSSGYQSVDQQIGDAL